MSLVAATFNVQHGLARGGVDPELLGRTCAALGADVLGLQEVDRGRWRSGRVDLAAAVAQWAGMAHAFGPALRSRWAGEYGNALLVRGELADVRVAALPRVGRHERRSALLATVLTVQHPLSVAVTHLSVHRPESERQLEAVVELLSARAAPRLLLADLNRRPGELQLLADAGFDVAGGEPSYPAAAPRLRIDHVAVFGLEVEWVRVPPTPCSDHRPVVARLRSRR